MQQRWMDKCKMKHRHASTLIQYCANVLGKYETNLYIKNAFKMEVFTTFFSSITKMHEMNRR